MDFVEGMEVDVVMMLESGDVLKKSATGGVLTLSSGFLVFFVGRESALRLRAEGNPHQRRKTYYSLNQILSTNTKFLSPFIWYVRNLFSSFSFLAAEPLISSDF